MYFMIKYLQQVVKSTCVYSISEFSAVFHEVLFDNFQLVVQASVYDKFPWCMKSFEVVYK